MFSGVLRHMQRYFSNICDGRCAGGLKKKLYLRSGSHAIDISQGSLTCPPKHRHGATLFIRLFRETAPFSRLLRHAGDKIKEKDFKLLLFICLLKFHRAICLVFRFLCRLRSIAAHRDNFVRRLSVRSSVSVCHTFLVVTHS